MMNMYIGRIRGCLKIFRYSMKMGVQMNALDSRLRGNDVKLKRFIGC